MKHDWYPNREIGKYTSEGGFPREKYVEKKYPLYTRMNA